MTSKPLGPFESEREARAAAHAAVPPAAGSSILAATGNRQLLGRALQDADVTMGRYDDRIVEWLAQWEDSVCAVIAAWIGRANRPTAITLTAAQAPIVARALADAEGYRRLRADQWCANCETAPQGACEDHLNDLDLADAYRDLATGLAEAMQPTSEPAVRISPAALPRPDDDEDDDEDDGQAGEPGADNRRLGEIRALLARFDWERDDRQYALEEIERIAERAS
jgi:hypothetical protein